MQSVFHSRGVTLDQLFCNTYGNLCGAIKQVRKCPLFCLILSFYPLDMAFEVLPIFANYSALQYVVQGNLCRGVYSSRKSKLFPSTKHHLPNPSPTSKLQVPSNQGHRSIFQKKIVMILWDSAKCLLVPTWGCLRGDVPPLRS